MPRFLLALLIAVAALLTACASPGDYYTAIQKTNDANLEIARVRAEADKARWTALGQIAASGDNTAKAVASVALAMGGGGQGGQPTQAVTPQQAQDPALAWASVIVPQAGQVTLRALDVSLGKVQAQANRDVSVANVQGMVNLGQAGVTATSTTALAGFKSQEATASTGFNALAATASTGFNGQANATQSGYTALVGLGQAAMKTPPTVTITNIGSGNTDSHNTTGSYNPTTTTSTTTDNHSTTAP